MRVAIGQINTTVGDFRGNTQKIIDYSRRAEEEGADLIVFPEMSICGYPPMDLLDYERFVQENLRSLRYLQRQLPKELGVLVGYVAKTRGIGGKALQNVVSVIYRGEIIHTQEKTLLPTYDVFDEARYFQPAAERRPFTFKGVKIGAAICEDIWWQSEPAPGTRYVIDPVKDLLDAGAELLLAPSASPFHLGKREVRRSLLETIGTSSGVPMIYVNMVGGNDNLIFDGASMVSNERGTVTAVCRGYGEDFRIFDTESLGNEVSGDGQEACEHLRRALVLGLRDYVEKCGFSSVHLGLSGGVDSALAAVLAVQALGPEWVRTFALPSRYSAESSTGDAERLAENLGVPFDVLPIEPMYDAALRTLEPVFGDSEFGVTEENIQARLRGVMLMAYSNKAGSLLLTTGNKSELATGYCTLYGDMAGGLSVIGDLLKREVYALCRHINAEREIIPEAIITKPPSAELRPDQKDEDSLPAYEILDGILSRYVVENKTADEITAEGFDPETVREIVALVGKNEYKRRQAPPVLKVSTRAFGTGRRMPIARHLFES
jgi:NAD+ synthase (glutamine-hydrolysing)